MSDAISEEIKSEVQGESYIIHMPEINPRLFGGNMRLGNHVTYIE